MEWKDKYLVMRKLAVRLCAASLFLFLLSCLLWLQLSQNNPQNLPRTSHFQLPENDHNGFDSIAHLGVKPRNQAKNGSLLHKSASINRGPVREKPVVVDQPMRDVLGFGEVGHFGGKNTGAYPKKDEQDRESEERSGDVFEGVLKDMQSEFDGKDKTPSPSGQQPQPVGQLVGQQAEQPVGQLPGQLVGQPVSQPVGQPAGQPVGKLAGQPVGQAAGQLVGQPVGQPAGQLVGQPVGQPVGQLAGQPVGQLAGQPVGQPVSQAMGQPDGRTAKPAFFNNTFLGSWTNDLLPYPTKAVSEGSKPVLFNKTLGDSSNDLLPYPTRPVTEGSGGGVETNIAQETASAQTPLNHSLVKAMFTAMPQFDGENVISMTLYGDQPRYTAGALRNAQLVKDNFPGWKLRIYTPRAGGVPARVLDKLRSLGVDFYFMEADQVPPMMWRFLVADDLWVTRFIVRDADSRLTERDAAAVSAWVKSGAAFGCIRDHPSHAGYPISGGLWGGRPTELWGILRRSWSDMMRGVGAEYLQDMEFLNKVIWPKVKAHSYCSDSVSCDAWPGAHPFPRPRLGYEHVGQVYNEQDLGRPGDISILRDAGENKRCVPNVEPSQLL